eukprot:7348459-Karenia_brevis.AAC.1
MIGLQFRECSLGWITQGTTICRSLVGPKGWAAFWPCPTRAIPKMKLTTEAAIGQLLLTLPFGPMSLLAKEKTDSHQHTDSM